MPIRPRVISQRPYQHLAAPTAISTFHSIGLYWSPIGHTPRYYDSDQCPLVYRPVGGGSWKEGFPLWYDYRTSVFKGSLMLLTPGTTYDIQLLPNHGAPVALTASTWSETFPVDPTKIHYYTSDMTTTLVADDSGSLANGYSLYAPEPGYEVTIDVNNSYNYCVDVRASYCIIRGFTMLDGIQGGVLLNRTYTPHDVVIEDNDISNWGDDTNFEGGIYGGGGYSSTNPTLQRIIIQRNKIHDPRYGAEDWTYGHPAGPQAVVLFNSGGNNVIRYNECYSPLTDHYFNDVLGAGANKESECGGGNEANCTGFPGRDSDIYCNYLANCYDDCIEADGKGRNVRIWANYIEYSLTCVSTAEIREGPIYIARNIYGYSGSGAYVGGECFLKCGDGDSRLVIVHNTCLQPSTHGIRDGLTNNGNNINNVFCRNNIFYTRSVNRYAVYDTGTGHWFDVDYDFANGLFKINNVNITPPHHIDFDGGDPDFGAQTFDQETGLGNFYLNSGSSGYHAAEFVPMFNDMYATPDVGAHQSGTDAMEFGVLAYSD